MRKTNILTLSAVLCALSFVLMLLGSLIDVLDLSAVMLASMISLFLYVECGAKHAWIAYAVTGVICLLLLPSKTVALEYILFGGCYPLCRASFEKLGKLPSLLLKLLVFNAALTVLLLALRALISTSDAPYGMTALTYAVGNAAFLLYDYALSRITVFWIRIIAPRLKRGKGTK